MLKRVGLLAAGNVLGQAIQLACQPVLGRMYPAEAFGELGQITALSNVAVVIGTLQMHTAVVMPRDRDEAGNVFSAGVLASTLVAATSLPVLLSFRHQIFGSGGGTLSAACACTLLFLAISYSNLVKGWQTAQGAFTAISAFSLVRAIALVAFQVGCGVLRIREGLLVGAIAGEWAAMAGIVLLRGVPGWTVVLRGMRSRVVWRTVVAYRDFALYGTVQELIAVAAFTLPLYMFVAQYSAAIGGQFAMAHRLVWAPAMLVGSALAQVLYHQLAREAGPLRREVLISRRHSLIIAVAAAVGMWVAPAALRLLLGSEWGLAGEFSRWLILWGASFVLAIPFRVCYRVLRLQRVQLCVDAAAASASLLAFLNADRLRPLEMMMAVGVVGVAQNAMLAGIMLVKLRETRAVATEAP